MSLPAALQRAIAAASVAPVRIVLGVAAGLFFAREFGELVPDSLAIGVCMFAAGYLAGAARKEDRSNAGK